VQIVFGPCLKTISNLRGERRCCDYLKLGAESLRLESCLATKSLGWAVRSPCKVPAGRGAATRGGRAETRLISALVREAVGAAWTSAGMIAGAAATSGRATSGIESDPLPGIREFHESAFGRHARNHSSRSPATKPIAHGTLQPQPRRVTILEKANIIAIDVPSDRVGGHLQSISLAVTVIACFDGRMMSCASASVSYPADTTKPDFSNGEKPAEWICTR